MNGPALSLEIAWWDWDAERISRSLEAIVGVGVEALRGVTGIP
jgi:hypothetical protein